MAQANQAIPRLTILRRKQVQARVGLSRSSIYAAIAVGTFPRPVALGVRSVGWVETEVDQWIAQQVKRSRSPAA